MFDSEQDWMYAGDVYANWVRRAETDQGRRARA